MTVRTLVLDAVRAGRDDLIEAARALIAAASPNPPLSTGLVAGVAADLIRRLVPTAEVTLHEAPEGVVNVVARIAGAGAGRRVVLSGHLDTYPVNQALPWTVDPLAGLVRDGRLYGRGAADMKGGIAASVLALAVLAQHRAHWRGEVVLALGGDEESMGELGTQFLLDHVPAVRADAVIIGDAGSPSVVRFGEKGFLWIEIEASGQAAHGAHVHLGVNAIDRLRAALDRVARLAETEVAAPAAVLAAIERARPISEALSGAGEAETLRRVTVNIGRISGGTSMNLVPTAAQAAVDIRLPVGITCDAAEALIEAELGPLPGVAWRVLRRTEPSFTAPDGEIVRCVAAAAAQVLGAAPAVNLRVGGSDSRLFRRAGIPTVVYGPTPHNMGGADEYATLEDLVAVAAVHALATLDFLGPAVG
jgi:acetylornithine deacetylase/succinyl-diaminopimelate desuccinylase-like protein